MKTKVIKVHRPIGAMCPVCGKNLAFFEKATMSTGKQRRILKCMNPKCRRETR